MAARKGHQPSKAMTRMGEDHRVKIANSNILNALLEHVDGQRDMSATQVTAGIALLKKVLPDYQSVDPDTGKAGVAITIQADALKL